jgi:pimeloyl-ACP methyl ester carboxylesterase
LTTASYFSYPTPWGSLRVYRYGQGPQLLIAQHGFGRDGRCFRKLGQWIGDQYTLLAPDLPFHGATDWTAPDYDATRWLAVVRGLAEHAGHAHFHYLGHSLGGRIAIKVFPELREQLLSFCLVAPDGLGGPYTHWIDQLPAPVVRGLCEMLRYPQGLFRLVRRLHRWRLLDEFSFQYVRQHLRDDSYRNRLRGTLRSLPDFRLRSRTVIAQLSQAQQPVRLYLGERDRLVDAERVSRIMRRVETVGVERLNRGHDLPSEHLQNFYQKRSERRT